MLTPRVQQGLNGFLEVAKTFLPGFALAVAAGDFQASGLKTALIRFASVNNGCELFDGHILAFFVAEEKQFVWPAALAGGGTPAIADRRRF